MQYAQLGKIWVFNKKFVENVEKSAWFFKKRLEISKKRVLSTRLFHIYNIFCVENFFADFFIFYIFSSWQKFSLSNTSQKIPFLRSWKWINVYFVDRSIKQNKKSRTRRGCDRAVSTYRQEKGQRILFSLSFFLDKHWFN